MKLFEKLMCINMPPSLYKETLLCGPPIMLVMLIVLVELMSFYECYKIVKVLKYLITIIVPSNFLVKSLLPGYIITIFRDETNYITQFKNKPHHPIILQHAKIWNKIYDVYYDNYINMILPILLFGYIINNICYILHTICTNSWRILFPCILSNLIITCTIMSGSLLYFYYKSLNKIWYIHCYIGYNNSIIKTLTTNLNNLTDDNENKQRLQELITETNYENNKLDKDYAQEIYFIDSTLKFNTTICILIICWVFF